MKPAEAYILAKPEPFRGMMLLSKGLIEQLLPDVTLHYKWGLPMFYSGKCLICYFNVTKGYFDLCFWVRPAWEVHLDRLCSENRKFVKSLRYQTQGEMDIETIAQCLQEAYRTRKPGFTG